VWDRLGTLMAICAGQSGAVNGVAKVFAIDKEGQDLSVWEGHGKLGIAVTKQAEIAGPGGCRVNRRWRWLLGPGWCGFFREEPSGGAQGQDSSGKEAVNGKPHQHSADPEERHGET
jgi:hypothetical protein